MAGERALDKRRLYLTVDEEVAFKIEKAYSKSGDKYPTDAFVRALGCAAKSVKLTEEDWKLIEERVKANARARVKLRSVKNTKSYGLRKDGHGAAKLPEKFKDSINAILQGEDGKTGGKTKKTARKGR